MFRRMRQIAALASTLCLLVAVIGCGTPQQKEEARTKSYGHDGYMGLSNSNPGLPKNSSYFSYSSDLTFMQEKLSELGGIQHAAFRIQDPDIYVTLTVSPELSENEAAALIERAHRMLKDNMPRYVIHMRPYKTAR